ncbi:MAG: hypothetical protein JWP03_732 [Phycisphaerales bacterium]|nr:hypothetical protein [Phycisphaerales bacterium]
MNPERDPLELELESYSPALPESLRAQIARAIDAERQVDRADLRIRRPARWVLAGALAAAACAAVSFAWFHHPRPGSVIKTHPAVEPGTTVVRQQEPGHPFATLAAYTRAVAGPPDQLDSLMNADAARSLPPGTAREIRAFARSFDDGSP